MDSSDQQLAGMRSRAQAIPLGDAERRAWAEQFNRLPAVRRFETAIDLRDEALVRVVLERIEEHHLGGLRLRAVNGAVLAGLFDCALGVAGTLQFRDKRAGTCELSIKLMRAVFEAPIEAFAVCVKRTDTLAFTESTLFSNGRLCAMASGLVAVAVDRGGEEAAW
ncbi:MAG TPA: PaaI family thioesterase [Steroidobacteraceae bacterium]|nr:PaaI family thioesterase [Steroidobacteraceae bacterium]